MGAIHPNRKKILRSRLLRKREKRPRRKIIRKNDRLINSLRFIPKFAIALSFLLFFQILMIVINPTGLSLTKVSMTMLVWVSCWFACESFYSGYPRLKKNIPGIPFTLYITLLLWNLTNIIRSMLFDTGPLTTLFGNTFTALALLVPVALSFSNYALHLQTANRLFLNIIKAGIPVYLVCMLFTGASTNETVYRVLTEIFYPVVFLITVIPYQTAKNKLIIVLASLIILHVAFVYSSRTMLGRIPLLYLCLIPLYFYRSFNMKWILASSMLILFIPVLFMKISADSKQSVFRKYLPADSELGADTRTFLYVEVLNDLTGNSRLIHGKGANGTYFSKYFKQTKQDTDNRLSVEVGILAILLKGGLIAVFLNLTIFFIAVYLAFFRSASTFLAGIGLMLLVHTLLLFVENLVSYSFYNATVWFFTGICFSRETRTLNDTDIRNILIYGTKTA